MASQQRQPAQPTADPDAMVVRKVGVGWALAGGFAPILVFGPFGAIGLLLVGLMFWGFVLPALCVLCPALLVYLALRRIAGLSPATSAGIVVPLSLVVHLSLWLVAGYGANQLAPRGLPISPWAFLAVSHLTLVAFMLHFHLSNTRKLGGEVN